MIYNRQLRIFLIFTIVSTRMIGDVFALDIDQHIIEESNNKSSIPSQYQDNDSSIETVGPPDSHEAMNNRPIYKNVEHQREKRNFEFLMGLIHNNSRYEVTKVDPEKPRQQQQQQQQQQEQEPKEMSQEVDSKASASELLLELMVRIAAHPDHWNKVHNLLQKIDNDLITSKRLIENIETVQTKSDGVSINVNKKVENIGTNASEKWPKFDNIENNSDRKVSFVNTLPTDNRFQTTTTTMTTNQQQQQPPQKHKSIYPKTFAYHRVTGRPLYLNKNPKAYIAVSVIAPKPINERSNNDDLSLEKELRQLKPWTHDQNLQNMATLRSRWVIQNDQHKTNIAP